MHIRRGHMLSIWSQRGNIWSILAPSPSSKTATPSHLVHCQNLHLECSFDDPRPAPQYRPKRDKYRPSCGPCWQSNVPCSGVYHSSREHVFICSNCLNTSTRCYYGTQDGKTAYPKYPTSPTRTLLPHYEQIVQLGRGTYSP